MTEAERLLRLHKVCSKCHHDKPWTEFFARERFEDGTVRRVTSWCKGCYRTASRERARRRWRDDPAGERARLRAVRKELRERDEDAYQARAREHRAAYRRRRGIAPRNLTVADPEVWLRLPIEPLRDWLERELRLICESRPDCDERTAAGLLAHRGGIHGRTLWRWRFESESAILDVVDAFACEYGEPMLVRDLWPDLYDQDMAA